MPFDAVNDFPPNFDPPDPNCSFEARQRGDRNGSNSMDLCDLESRKGAGRDAPVDARRPTPLVEPFGPSAAPGPTSASLLSPAFNSEGIMRSRVISLAFACLSRRRKRQRNNRPPQFQLSHYVTFPGALFLLSRNGGEVTFGPKCTSSLDERAGGGRIALDHPVCCRVSYSL